MSESDPKASPRFPIGWVLGSLLWLAVFAVLYVGWSRSPAPEGQAASNDGDYEIVPLGGTPEPGVKFEQITVPEFQLVSQEDKPITREDLLGKPWVASFIFTHCAGPCTTLTKTVMDLNAATKDVPMHYVSFTVDPARDDPQQLAKYAEVYAANPERWLFLTGEKETIYDLIRGTFQLVVEEEPKNTAQIGFEFAHSTRLIHVDAEGKIAGTYKGEDPAEVAVLRRVLLGQMETPRKNQYFKVVPENEEKEALEVKTTQIPLEKEIIIRAQNEDAAEVIPAVPEKQLPAWIARLPLTNAILNGAATILLVAGYIAIKSKHAHTHRNLMISAFVMSVLFLGFYLTYHFGMQYYLGDASKKFTGTGWIRPVYYTILLTHVLLAMAVPVLALMTFYRAFKSQWDKHKAIAKITFPIWLYVSVTGVVIYGMLYHWPAAQAG